MQGNILVIALILFELIGPKHRNTSMLFSGVAFAMGGVSLAAIAYYLMDWRHLSFVGSVLYLVSLVLLR